jgi:membrane protease YdiL (CAAX protease family)
VRRYSTTRIACWFVLVGAFAAVAYVARFTGAGNRGQKNALYAYSTALNSLVLYAIFFALVYAIAAVDLDGLFAFRRPRSWPEAGGLCLVTLLGIYAWSAVVAELPLPQSPGNEQGITPPHWQPSHTGAYAVNFLVIALVAPLVEELTFRGVGFGLLLPFGAPLAIAVIGVMFGLEHGLLEGLLILIPLGLALVVIRWRTQSVVPGMILHGVFNSVALFAVLFS